MINVVIALPQPRLGSWRIELPDQVQGHLNKHGKRARGAEPLSRTVLARFGQKAGQVTALSPA